MPAHRFTDQIIRSPEALTQLLGEPAPIVRTKISPRLNTLTRRLIEESPFVCLATADRDGHCDVSPRGDPAGFVRILDDTTLLLPERPGNRLADSLRNILENPHVGLLFILPGITDTFRVNGRATLTTDPVLLAPCAVEGKVPQLAILIDIEEAFTHCSKAFIRSGFWNPERFLDRSTFPSAGELLKELNGADFDACRYDQEREARYARREGLY